MRVIVMGAAGFIGKHLVRRLLSDGHGVFQTDLPDDSQTVIYRQEGGIGADIRWNVIDVAPRWLGPSNESAVAVHLAAIASPNVCAQDPANAWATNVMGTYNVLNWLKGLGVRRVVFMSSAHVYGISPKYLPTDENHPLHLLDPYTVTKIVGEELCERFWRSYGLSYCALRLFNGYGPLQDSAYFIGAKIAQARTGKVTIKGGHVTKDFVHVSDVCDAIVKALESDYVGPVNIGTGVETKLYEVASRISAKFGAHLEDDGLTDSGPTRMCCDWSRAKRVLGWEPKVKFQDGLYKLIEDSIAAAT